VLLELTHVAKHFFVPDGRSTLPVLRDVSLSVAAGDSVAVTGPSGSGKSTLLNIMGALDLPTSGTVKMGGRPLSGLPDRELAGIRNLDVGFVFQMHHLLPQCTALENVLVPTVPRYGKKNAESTQGRARALLERVGLADRMEHRPGQLSGGECQRVAVARALINGPRILLADEPTGSLDRACAEMLIELLVELNRESGVALIVVTHSMELAGRMKKLFGLRDGALVRAVRKK
jgi:predicted ABC-type transport system involved in lysophospholipase L1 biosynthesis ATPase subunit